MILVDDTLTDTITKRKGRCQLNPQPKNRLVVYPDAHGSL